MDNLKQKFVCYERIPILSFYIFNILVSLEDDSKLKQTKTGSRAVDWKLLAYCIVK